MKCTLKRLLALALCLVLCALSALHGAACAVWEEDWPYGPGDATSPEEGMWDDEYSGGYESYQLLQDENGDIVGAELTYAACSSGGVFSIDSHYQGYPVTTIGTRAISGTYSNYAWVEVFLDIPDTVKEIESCAFYSDYTLNITFTGPAPQFAPDAFQGTEAWIVYPSDDPGFQALLDQDFGGDITWVAGDPIHNFEETASTAPTCTEAGESICTCTFCGITKTDSVAPTGHSYEDGTVTKEPTCIEAGELAYTCTVCNETVTEPIAPADHSHEDGTVTKEPTCTEAGELAYTCTVCNETVTEPIAPTGHSYGEGVVTREPTCDKVGKFTRTCTVCGSTKTTDIPSTSHQYISYWAFPEVCLEYNIFVTECKLCGDMDSQEEPLLAHAFENGICSRCGVADHPDYQYTIREDGSCTIILYDGKDKEVVIPAELGGCPVTCLASMSFMWKNIVSVQIPGTVQEIFSDAFLDCQSLTSITFMGDAPEIGNEAFDEVTATVYYPAGNPTWTKEVRQHYGGQLTWVPYEVEYTQGDVNGDGKVNIGDVARIYAHARGSAVLEGQALTLADINGDGKINIGDAAKLYAQIKG